MEPSQLETASLECRATRSPDGSVNSQNTSERAFTERQSDRSAEGAPHRQASGASGSASTLHDPDALRLHEAASQALPRQLMEVLSEDALPAWTTNSAGETPLHVSARCSGSVTAVLLLVSRYGASSQRDAYGSTFFHHLMANERIEPGQLALLVEWLLAYTEALTLLNFVNGEGRTAYDVALMHHASSNPLVVLLLEWGALTGALVRCGEVLDLEHREEVRRTKLQTHEGNAWDHLCRTVNNRRRRIQRLLDRIDRRVVKEEVSRDCLAHQESVERAEWEREASASLERVSRQRHARWVQGAQLLQCMGRGYLSRRMTSRRYHAVGEEPLASRSLPLVCHRCHAHQEREGGWAEPHIAAAESSEALEQCGKASTSTVGTSTTQPMDAEVAVGSPSLMRERGEMYEELLDRDRRRLCAAIIWLAYRRHRRRRQCVEEEAPHQVSGRPCVTCTALVACEGRARGFLDWERYQRQRWSAIRIQRCWRRFRGALVMRRVFVRMIEDALRCYRVMQDVQQFGVRRCTEMHQKKISRTTAAITQLVWRENFCSAFRFIVFQKRRREGPRAKAKPLKQRWNVHARRRERYLLLIQLLISLSVMIYMGAVPRTRESRAHNSVDIACCAVQLVVVAFLPVIWSRVVDLVIVLTALCCAVAGVYEGVLVLCLLVLKLPFVVRAFATEHPSTRTYCRAIEQCFLYLVLFSPLAAAVIGSSVRGSALNDLLLTREGNWGSVFIFLWSTLGPQYAVEALRSAGQPWPDYSRSPVSRVRAQRAEWTLENGMELARMEMPFPQVLFFTLSVFFFSWVPTMLGTHDAIRRHYDVSDKTKLRKNRRHFPNEGSEKLLDTHRAPNMQALGDQLDGVVCETDILAAKEAIASSHYDHNTDGSVRFFVGRVHDSVLRGRLGLEDAGVFRQTASVLLQGASDKWDCRNEDPQSRCRFDMDVIEAALGMVVRKSAVERFFERQWIGPVFRRETNLIVIGMLMMASIEPNLFSMEAIFSTFWTMELLLSFYFLRLEFILSHYMRLLVRVFCILVGCVPYFVPFVALRSVRLCEGLSEVYTVPGMVRWGFVYLLGTLLTLWLIAFVAALQFKEAHRGRPEVSLCQTTASCLAISLRELTLPAWTPEHIDVTREAPVMCLMVVLFQLFFIPFVLSFVLHPLLQLSSFIGRFLRLVVQSLHRDVLEYVNTYLERASWYEHWMLKTNLPVSIATKLKLWVLRMRGEGRAWRPASSRSPRAWTRAGTFQKAAEGLRRLQPRVPHAYLTEIVSRGELTSFEENARSSRSKESAALRRWKALTRRPALHYTNVAVTLVSIAFLWIASSTTPRGSAQGVYSSLAHLSSVILSVIVMPKDFRGLITLVSLAFLVTGVAFFLLPTGPLRTCCAIRFGSLLRLVQLQVYPFRQVLRLAKAWTESIGRILFPILVIGVVVYVAELLRVQLYLVVYYQPKEEEEGDPLENLSYPQRLAGHRRMIPSYPNAEDARDLFSFFFWENAYIYYSMFNYWMLPAVCVSSFFAYLLWTGANVLDTNRLMINLIPLLEDPITVAGAALIAPHNRWPAAVVLVISLVSGCLLSPSTRAAKDDWHLFFALEIVFTIVGLADAIAGMAFSVHRCGRTWALRSLGPPGDSSLFFPVCDLLLLVGDILGLLYYATAMPLCAALLNEGDTCLITADQYASYFISLRFMLLLRLLPRQFLLPLMGKSHIFFMGAVSVVIYFVGATSALADIAAAELHRSVDGALWMAAFEILVRQTSTCAIPARLERQWTPYDAAKVAAEMVDRGVDVVYTSNNYVSSTVLFILAILGKIFIASACGLGVGLAWASLQPVFVSPLPPKSAFLYETLCGGVKGVVRVGMLNSDDMRPEARRRIQQRKFQRIFHPEGIPSWSLPHLLEELSICLPTRQRRMMFTFAQLLAYMPISLLRQSRVQEYMELWDTYQCGGPVRLHFTNLPVFPPGYGSWSPANPLSVGEAASTSKVGFIAPLSLVQALAFFELNFPSDSSMGTKLWMDFFSVTQKIRGATLMQSLWRMYREETVFDADPTRSLRERITIVLLRQSFRRNRITSDVRFRSHASFSEALRYERKLFNPETGHYDLLNRLHGSFVRLQPPVQIPLDFDL